MNTRKVSKDKDLFNLQPGTVRLCFKGKIMQGKAGEDETFGVSPEYQLTSLCIRVT